MKTSKNSNYSQTHKDGEKVKGISLFLVQCLLAIFIKTLAAIIVSQGSHKTSQELRMVSNVTLNCQATDIVMNSVFQLSE